MNDVRESRRIMKLSRKLLAVLLAAVAISIPVLATVDLFAHSLHPVSASVVTTICGPDVTALNLPPPSGTGNVLFGCTNTLPVLTVASGGGKIGVWVSNLSAPARLTLVPTMTIPCSGGIWVIDPSITFSASQAGNYWYCLQNVSSPTPWVDVHWYQQ